MAFHEAESEIETRYHPGINPDAGNTYRPSDWISPTTGLPFDPRSRSGVITTIPPESGRPMNVTVPSTAMGAMDFVLHPAAIKHIAAKGGQNRMTICPRKRFLKTYYRHNRSVD